MSRWDTLKQTAHAGNKPTAKQLAYASRIVERFPEAQFQLANVTTIDDMSDFLDEWEDAMSDWDWEDRDY